MNNIDFSLTNGELADLLNVLDAELKQYVVIPEEQLGIIMCQVLSCLLGFSRAVAEKEFEALNAPGSSAISLGMTMSRMETAVRDRVREKLNAGIAGEAADEFLFKVWNAHKET